MSGTGGSGADSDLETHQAIGLQTELPTAIQVVEPYVSGSNTFPSFPVDEESDDQEPNDDDLQSRSIKVDKDKRTISSINYVDINDISDPEEQSFFTRSNRFLGPDSTWRSWTKDEREAVTTIDEERAQDLSIHLFNAHSLRQRAQRTSCGPRKKAKRRSESESGEVMLFEPPKLWTAWPLPPFEVPRTSLIDPADDPRPSATLEECLIAATMRAARHRWEAREWEDGDEDESQHPSDTGSLLIDQVSTRSSKRNQDDGLPRVDERTSDKADVPLLTSSFAPSSDESATHEDHVESWGGKVSNVPESRPVPLVDDETARVLLLPSTRHILGNFDDMLHGLHYARQSYAASKPESEETTIDSTSQAGEAARTSTRGKTPIQRQRAGFDASARSTSTRRTKAMRSRHKEPRDVQIERLGLRDWSDVLGMAALTGWDGQVLRRASKRCADLFGEDMLFRTFHEGGIDGEDAHFTDFLASGYMPEDENNAISDNND